MSQSSDALIEYAKRILQRALLLCLAAILGFTCVDERRNRRTVKVAWSIAKDVQRARHESKSIESACAEREAMGREPWTVAIGSRLCQSSGSLDDVRLTHWMNANKVVAVVREASEVTLVLDDLSIVARDHGAFSTVYKCSPDKDDVLRCNQETEAVALAPPPLP